MQNFKLTLEYDGTRFFGFQKQAEHRTVQSELERALEKLLQKKIKITGAGRTDSGVHAQGQVVNFFSDTDLSPEKIQLGLNHFLPDDLSVVKIDPVSPTFHAQFSAKWKTYEYRIWNSKTPSPLHRYGTYRYSGKIHISKMNKAAHILSGRHDFRVFESSGSRRKSAVRTIRKLTIQKKGPLIIITIESNGFLYRMARTIVGTLLSFATGRLQETDLDNIFSPNMRRYTGPTLPAHGLLLKHIIY